MTDKQLAQRLRDIIGGASARSFAKEAGISDSTLRSILAGSRPTVDNLVAIAKAANVTVDWLATGQRTSTAGPSEAEFVLIPRYDVVASAGPGAFADRERVLDHMAFRRDWVRRYLGVDPRKLVLITAIGDSMEPTIRAGDLLLVDTSIGKIVDDSVYVIVTSGGDIVVKRVQQFMDGSISINSDNRTYESEKIPPADSPRIIVAGRVRWVGRIY